MKFQLQWIALVMMFVIGVAGSLGCATMAASSISDGSRDFYYKPILNDEIVAIGRLDTATAKEIEQDNVVAFIGLKNTYLLNKGGDELLRISQLKLDGKRMDIDAARSYKLYKKDNQVWGELILTYGGGNVVTLEEKTELEKGGFTPIKGGRSNQYQITVAIEGVIYPVIKLSDEQMSKLTTRRAFSLYNPRDAKPPVMRKILKNTLIATGMALDLTNPLVGIGIFWIGLPIVSH